MDLSDLKKIDLKNIDLKDFDASKVVPLLLEKKELLAQVVVVVVSIVIGISIVGNYFAQDKKYREDLAKLKAKSEAIDTYEGIVKKTKIYFKAVPKALDEDELSSMVAEYAAKDNISILSFSPGQKKTEGLSEVITVHLSVRTNTYKDLLSFINSIEKGSFPIRIDSCSIVPEHIQESNNKNKQDNSMEAQIDLSSVGIKI